MALKGRRKVDEGSDVAYFMNELPTGVTYLEAGCVVIHDGSTGTGHPGDGNNTVVVPTGTGGVPLGILACDVEDIDLSKYPHWNRNHKDVVPLCHPVTVYRHGYCYTNRLASGATPTPGAVAYYAANGLLTHASGSVAVGRFRGTTDADGYVGVDITVGV